MIDGYLPMRDQTQTQILCIIIIIINLITIIIIIIIKPKQRLFGDTHHSNKTSFLGTGKSQVSHK